MTPSWRGANKAKITVNVSMGFWPTWNRYNAATKRRISNICHDTLNSFIDIIHSKKNKPIKESTTSEKFEL